METNNDLVSVGGVTNAYSIHPSEIQGPTDMTDWEGGERMLSKVLVMHFTERIFDLVWIRSLSLWYVAPIPFFN